MIFVTAFIITVISIICCKEIKKPTVRVIFGMVAFFNILIMILAGSITYTTKYKIHEVASYNSPDEKYELLFQQVGDPDWPFGHTHARLVLTDESGTIGKCSFDIADDGGNACPDQCQVTWKDTYVEAVISGKEQDDNQYILYFDGKTDSKQLSEIPEWEKGYELPIDEREREEAEGSEVSAESSYWVIPQADNDLFTEEEKEQLQSMVLSAAESVGEIYRDIVIADAPDYSSGVDGFTGERGKAVVEQLGRKGLVSIEEDTNMQNHEKMEAFYADYLNGRESMVTVFDVHRDGLIGAVTFIYRNEKLQTYYIGVRWKEGGVPEIQGTSVSDVSEIKLTEKGYFIYAHENIIEHASLREYWRIEPLPEDCRELTEKYISGLSYVNYNMLVTNWDSDNIEDILMPCMYEDLYRIYTGENLRTGEIPAEEYEKIMSTYLPVSVEQLREHCKYDEDSDSYECEMIFSCPHPPFGEVVDYTKNTDGTITLIVDGVWPDYDSDLAFRNTIVVQPFEDGTFRYLSNTIEEKELELPPIAKTNG